jgi:hypothetical protein
LPAAHIRDGDDHVEQYTYCNSSRQVIVYREEISGIESVRQYYLTPVTDQILCAGMLLQITIGKFSRDFFEKKISAKILTAIDASKPSQRGPNSISQYYYLVVHMSAYDNVSTEHLSLSPRPLTYSCFN